MLTSIRSRRVRGFTIVELVVLLALIAIISLLGMPALLSMIHRARVDGAVREAATLVRAARMEAIKVGRPTGVLADTGAQRLTLFIDQDSSGDFSPGDRVLRELTLPDRVTFSAPLAGGDDALVVQGFQTSDGIGWVIFSSDGSADNTGAFRLGDQRGNFLEVQVAPRATGRVGMRKWHADSATWRSQGEGGQSWSWN